MLNEYYSFSTAHSKVFTVQQTEFSVGVLSSREFSVTVDVLIERGSLRVREGSLHGTYSAK